MRGSSAWLTPPHILSALGDFDLDPCGLASWPTARVINEYPSDGLSMDWSPYGSVWLSPPEGSSSWAWLHKLAEHPSGGVALVFARTETSGFHHAVWERADGLLFLRRRLRFHRPDGQLGPQYAASPSVLVAYGSSNVTRLERSGLPGAFMTNWLTSH